MKDEPKVSIIVPSSDHRKELSVCIDSIEKSTYKNFEILIVENNSVENNTFEYYEDLKKRYDNIRVLRYEDSFNYSKINNFAVRHSDGEYLVLLNNDTKLISQDWLQELLSIAQRKDVGAVGTMLYYPDETIQHAGIILGFGGVAAEAFKKYPRGDVGYTAKLCFVRNVAAVTGACMMIRKEVWDEVGGLDEDFKVAFNDVDLCMRIRQKAYLIVWTPFVELYHYESRSRGADDAPEKIKVFEYECNAFIKRWFKELEQGDPYYNRNLSMSISFIPKEEIKEIDENNGQVDMI